MAVHTQPGRRPGAITPCLNRGRAFALGAVHRLPRGRALCERVSIVVALVGLAWSPAAGAATVARISVRGDRLYAGAKPWRAWGMNWGLGDHAPVISYFDHPTAANLAVLRTELGTARAIGANSMRIYLELGQVMATPTRPREQTLVALRRLLALAQQDRVYLDITGDLVWRPSRAPAWYGRMSWQARWRVQARFWKFVAHTAASSPAVLCYELTSEPIVAPTSGYYYGQIGNWWFVQSIATATGRRANSLARSWTRMMATAVRSQDDRPVTIGLLPETTGPFAPANIADLLDMLIVHEYPTTGQAPAAISMVRSFAARHKPVLIGETFTLDDDEATQDAFLTGATPSIVGAFEFFDGSDPATMAVRTIYDAIYQESLEQFRSLRPLLLEG
ncbi:MAG TPA: hypothetical protein VGF93_15915 [Solirubrobacteraceae bacterium]